MSGRTSRQGPASDAVASRHFGGSESDPDDRRSPQDYGSHGSVSGSESPRGSMGNAASLNSEGVPREAHDLQPDVSGYDGRDSHDPGYDERGRSPYGHRAENGDDLGYGGGSGRHGRSERDEGGAQ